MYCYKNRDQLSLTVTNPRDALHRGNVDAQCNKLATELVENASRRKLYITCKKAAIDLPHLYLAPPFGDPV